MILRPGRRPSDGAVVGARAEPRLEARHAVRLFQEVRRAHAVMTDEAEQRRAVAQPVHLAQALRFVSADADEVGDVVADGDVHLAERGMARVVQRVVEVEQPDRRRLHRDRIIVP